MNKVAYLILLIPLFFSCSDDMEQEKQASKLKKKTVETYDWIKSPLDYSRTETYEYDEDGNLQKYKLSSISGFNEIRYIYKNGLISETKEYDNYDLQYVSEYSYNDSNLVCQIIKRGSWSLDTLKFYYDKNGHLTREEEYSNGKLRHYKSYVRNSMGEIETETSEWSTSENPITYSYLYDHMGNTIETYKYSYDTQEWEPYNITEYSYEFDDKSRLTKMTRYSDDFLWDKLYIHEYGYFDNDSIRSESIKRAHDNGYLVEDYRTIVYDYEYHNQ